MSASSYLPAYRCLREIFEEGAYLGEALGRALPEAEPSDRSRLTYLVYGVLDRAIALDDVISRCCRNPPPAARIILRMGTYLGRHSQMPRYAVVNEMVELCRAVGRAGLCGFVNATLKNCITQEAPPTKDPIKALSLRYSMPEWIVRKYLRQYGEDAEKLLAFRPKSFEHIRFRGEREAFVEQLSQRGVSYELSSLSDAVWADYAALNASDLPKFLYAKMNFGSMEICRMSAGEEVSEILDACAAPGGKSCYLADLYPASKIIACDVHPHRLELIRGYAGRLNLGNVLPRLCDASVSCSEFVNRFGLVLADVPCSGLGILYSKPDVKLNRFPEDIPELARVQESILDNVSRYVKSGGALIYSTCTLLREENEDVIYRFLKGHDDFKRETERKLTPASDGCEGFYMVRMRRA